MHPTVQPTLVCCTRRYTYLKDSYGRKLIQSPYKRSGHSNTEGGHVKTGKASTQKLKREISEDTNPTNNLILDFYSPELGGGGKFLLFKAIQFLIFLF